MVPRQRLLLIMGGNWIFSGGLLSLLSFAGWLYLAFGHGKFWQPLLPVPAPEPESWPSIDIIVPARNEATVLPATLPSLLAQDYPGDWRIILIDDHSDDNTAEAARQLTAQSGRLYVIKAPEVPENWQGKLAAMQAGVAESNSDYILFTDADIRHPNYSLRRLMARAVAGKLDLVSRMVRLHCASTAEKFLIPAFVFFFAMLYPFRHGNDWDSRVAAAAGGVMLIKRRALDNIGGLARIKDALIDDCALARAVKDSGGDYNSAGRIELTLSDTIESLRAYPGTGDIWGMIARTAFTQLKYSLPLLAGTVIGILLLFVAPVFWLVSGWLAAAIGGLLSWAVMTIIYMPTVRFYRLSPVWAVTLPLAALVFLGATIDSARLYWQGKGGHWKGRSQA